VENEKDRGQIERSVEAREKSETEARREMDGSRQYTENSRVLLKTKQQQRELRGQVYTKEALQKEILQIVKQGRDSPQDS